jgi:hypothetical protein
MIEWNAIWVRRWPSELQTCLRMYLMGYLGNWPHYYRINVLQRTNNFHQQHSHKTEKFENHLQFRNNFLANLQKRAQFSKHFVSFMQFSETYVIVTQSSESAQCRLDLHLFQAGKFHGTYAFTRYQGNAMGPSFSISALGSVYDVAQKKSMTLWTKASLLHVVRYETPCCRDWLLIGDFLIPRN